MLKLSTRERYAMRAVVDLCRKQEKGDDFVKLSWIASRQGISAKYLESIFSALRRAGILKSRRGAVGGYYLNGSPDSITALAVVQALEGPMAIVDCCLPENRCERAANCPTRKLWQGVNGRISSYLADVPLRQLM